MDITLLIESFGKYGLPGLIILGMGYALHKQSASHKEERKEWNKTIDKHFAKIIDTITSNTTAMASFRQLLNHRKTDRLNEGKKND